MRLPIDYYFLELLEHVAARSTCVRRAVAAIIVDDSYRILSTGYNGVPRGHLHCDEHPCPGSSDIAGDTARCEAVHAEVNAVIQCTSLERADTLYVSCTPCFSCAKMICNTNIQRVVVLEEYADAHGLEMLRRSGIDVDKLNPKK